MRSAPTRRGLLLSTGLAAGALLAGCATRGAAPAGRPTAWLPRARWDADLDALDSGVRAVHPDPWAIHPESAWKAGLAGLRKRLPGLSRTAAVLALIEQVALLDTHSGILPEEAGLRQYGLALRSFADGLFVVAAEDPSLTGARLTAVGRMPVERLLEAVKPFVNADNDSAFAALRPWMLVQVEVLQALGAVPDARHPRFAFAMPDGSTTTIDVPIVPLAAFDTIFGSMYRAGTPAAWRACLEHEVQARLQARAVVLTYASFDQDPTAALATMRAALRDRRADRVVFDQRYCGGGDYAAGEAVRSALAASDVRGRLTVVTGYDNSSASGAQASWLRRRTRARFVGEAPSTVPNTFLDDAPFTLPGCGLTVHVPSTRMTFFADDRRSLEPDRVVRDRGASFFRGVDDTLPVALG